MTNTETMRPVEAKTIVKQSSLGHPMMLLGADENLNKALMGRIIGFATGISQSTVTDPEDGLEKRLKSLVGSFKAIPIDPRRPCVTSAKLGLPMHIMQPVIDLLEAEKGTGLIVEIAWDVGVERSKNPAGYSWYGVPLVQPAADDPLELLEKRLVTGGKLAAISHHSEPSKVEDISDHKSKGTASKRA